MLKINKQTCSFIRYLRVDNFQGSNFRFRINPNYNFGHWSLRGPSTTTWTKFDPIWKWEIGTFRLLNLEHALIYQRPFKIRKCYLVFTTQLSYHLMWSCWKFLKWSLINNTWMNCISVFNLNCSHFRLNSVKKINGPFWKDLINKPEIYI